MSERFAKKWEQKRETGSFKNNLKEAIIPQPPLKSRMNHAVKRLELQIQKLDKSSERFTQKDKSLFKKIVDAYETHDTARANIYANELAEVRKMERLIMNSRLALDQVLLRLRTCTEFGDIVATLGPAIGVLRSVSKGIGGVIPDAENEIGDISNILSGLMFDCGASSGMSMNFDNVNEDASKILAEAAAVAEQKISANLPELPYGIAGTTSNQEASS